MTKRGKKSGAKKWLVGGGIVGGLYLGACACLAWFYVNPPRKAIKALPPSRSHLVPGPYADIPVNEVMPGIQKPVIIFAHGLGGSPSSMTIPAEEMIRRGCGVVIITMKGQTKSQSRGIGFGLKESEEILAVARWVRKRHAGHRVGIYGVSMGGAATWLAAEKEPALFDVVATEGAYAKLDEAISDFAGDQIPAGSFLLSPVIGFARLFSEVNPGEVVPEKAAKSWRGRPGLIIHAGNDELFPRSHAERLSRAAGLELWEIPGAKHAQGIKQDPKGFADRFLALFP